MFWGGSWLFTLSPKEERRGFLPGPHRPHYSLARIMSLSAALQHCQVNMAPWHDFDSIFYFNRGFFYDGKVIEQIVANRRALENQLFVDKLLGLTGVRAGISPWPQSRAILTVLISCQSVSPEDKQRPPITRSADCLCSVRHPPKAGLGILHLAGLPWPYRCCHSIRASVPFAREIQAVYRRPMEFGQTRIQGSFPDCDYDTR